VTKLMCSSCHRVISMITQVFTISCPVTYHIWLLHSTLYIYTKMLIMLIIVLTICSVQVQLQVRTPKMNLRNLNFVPFPTHMSRFSHTTRIGGQGNLRQQQKNKRFVPRCSSNYTSYAIKVNISKYISQKH